MDRPAATSPRPPATARGRATRERIVRAAAELIHVRGVAGTSLDDVCTATSTSKSQLYHYFADKSALVCAVIACQQEAVLTGQEPFLSDFSTLRQLRQWRDHLVEVNTALVSHGGCPMGGLASEVASTDVAARHVSAAAFEVWRDKLAGGLHRMVDAGELAADTDADTLALGLLAAVQGGLLLSQLAQDVRPLAGALDTALAAVQARQVASVQG